MFQRRNDQIKYINDLHGNLKDGYDEIDWGERTDFPEEEELLSKLNDEYRRIQMKINDLSRNDLSR